MSLCSVLSVTTCLISVTHYSDVIMGGIASLITSLTLVYSTVYSDADQRKHQSSASLAFVRGIRRGPVNSPHKLPVTRKMFPFRGYRVCRAALSGAEKILSSHFSVTHCGLVTPCGDRDLGLWIMSQVMACLPDGMKPLHETVLVYHQLFPVAFTWGYHHTKNWRYQSVKQDWKFAFSKSLPGLPGTGALNQGSIRITSLALWKSHGLVASVSSQSSVMWFSVSHVIYTVMGCFLLLRLHDIY